MASISCRSATPSGVAWKPDEEHRIYRDATPIPFGRVEDGDRRWGLVAADYGDHQRMDQPERITFEIEGHDAISEDDRTLRQRRIGHRIGNSQPGEEL